MVGELAQRGGGVYVRSCMAGGLTSYFGSWDPYKDEMSTSGFHRPGRHASDIKDKGVAP